MKKGGATAGTEPCTGFVLIPTLSSRQTRTLSAALRIGFRMVGRSKVGASACGNRRSVILGGDFPFFYMAGGTSRDKSAYWHYFVFGWGENSYVVDYASGYKVVWKRGAQGANK